MPPVARFFLALFLYAALAAAFLAPGPRAWVGLVVVLPFAAVDLGAQLRAGYRFARANPAAAGRTVRRAAFVAVGFAAFYAFGYLLVQVFGFAP